MMRRNILIVVGVLILVIGVFALIFYPFAKGVAEDARLRQTPEEVDTLKINGTRVILRNIATDSLH